MTFCTGFSLAFHNTHVVTCITYAPMHAIGYIAIRSTSKLAAYKEDTNAVSAAI